jgi:peptide/nickel transport system permease protein
VTGFVLRRAGQTLLALFGVAVVVCSLMHLVEGDPIRAAQGARFDPELHQLLLERSGLDRPLPVQFVDWMTSAATGDLGVSFRTGRSVTSELLDRLPATVLLAVGSLVVGLLIAVPAGVVSAVRQGRPVD